MLQGLGHGVLAQLAVWRAHDWPVFGAIGAGQDWIQSRR